MRLISHRGNVDSIQPKRENTQEYIDEAIDAGFDVEIDIWGGEFSKFYFGHDKPEKEVGLYWLHNNKRFLWIHAKNFEALSLLSAYPYFRVFYHKTEDHVLISNSDGLFWSHNLEEAEDRSIIPLLSEKELLSYDKSKKVFGICSDFVGKYGKN